MKNIKISSFIFMLISIFFLTNIIGYLLLYESMKSSHEKETRILFLKIKNQTSDLLAKQIHQYILEKPKLLQKHKIVQAYLQKHDLNVSLNEIYAKINPDPERKPYNIYITDKNLTIRNTTNAKNMGFNLSFAKATFEQHKKEHIVGCSYPIRDIETHNFFSYTDSYLSRKGDDRAAIMQVSYTYKFMAKDLIAMKKLLREYPFIQEVKTYNFGQNGFVYDMVLLDDPDPHYTHSNEYLLTIQKNAQRFSHELQNSELLIKPFSKNGVHYQQLYMTSLSPISKEIRIVYSLLLNDELYYSRINQLNLLLLFSIIIGLIGIYFIAKVRDKEIKLSDQDKFVQSAMHEIKTPLSIITLNNELRQIEQGTDAYSEEIDNALKVLHNSYRSMSFIMTNDPLIYKIETLDLSQIVKERIEYFQTIAMMNNKKIIFNIDSHHTVDMSLIELTRLIDNSLYNAIKYSAVGSQIKVVLLNDLLSFHNEGKAIEEKEKVFQKYFRENNTVGGYGLGLSIVKDIAEKYDIDIKLESDPEHGTTFTYRFKILKSA